MNTFHAECFLALSRSLNFTQTSEEMFISQPTLSRNIAALEQEIGVQLLVRNTKTVELTPAGRVFADFCAGSLDALRHSVEEARLARDGITGSLKLGIQQDTFEPFSVDLIRRFRRDHPGIELEIRPYSLSRMVQKLNAGKVDLIIGPGKSNLKQPGSLLLNERPECAVLPPEHPLAARECLRIEELREENFVAMSPTASTSGHYLLLKYAEDAGFLPRIVATADCVPTLMMMVACGIGISVLYRDLAISTHHRLSFVPLEGLPSFKRYLMWDEENRNPALNAFLRCAEEYLAEKESSSDR
jgi:DNA-binding transcriptional LysR family regulator